MEVLGGRSQGSLCKYANVSNWDPCDVATSRLVLRYSIWSRFLADSTSRRPCLVTMVADPAWR